jgi:hypothetical protein
MSEYQYYEFQAIDKPLDAEQMAELRSYSTRARITAASFINEYNWGNFKGNADRWMERYFDAFLYLANWGTHVLKLRLAAGLLDPKVAKQYCNSDSAFVRVKDGQVVLTFASDDEGGDEWAEGEGQLSSMISVRAELARGDLRALYLGWLLGAQSGDLDDEDIEPVVPPGLGQLSASLESLADFLRIDADLLCVAAQSSPSLPDRHFQREEFAAWVASLPAGAKDDLITNFLVDGDRSAFDKLLQSFLKERSVDRNETAPNRRTIGELLRGAQNLAEERERTEAQRRAREEARRKRATALAREKYLASLVGSEPRLWEAVRALIATTRPKSYDEALKVLVDLRDLESRTKSGEFATRVEMLRRANASKPAFIKRLGEAGFS